jgi:hypothetical protein
MQFSKDVSHYRPTPRTLQTSRMGPYARLSVEKRKSIADWACAIGIGACIGVMWYVTVLARA